MKCPQCGSTSEQIKAGKNTSGSQKWRCKLCRKNITPEPKVRGYSTEVKTQALRLYVEGNSLRGMGRILGIHHQTVANWFEQIAEHLPPGPFPQQPEVGELDELFTFIEDKKTDTIS